MGECCTRNLAALDATRLLRAMRCVRGSLVGAVLFCTLCAHASTPPQSLPYYKNGRFQNARPKRSRHFWHYLWMRLHHPHSSWPKHVALQKHIVLPKPYSKVPRVYFVNHSTFLIQASGVNILTDPIFSKRASPVTFAGPKRVIAPGIPKTKLPHIDFIVISHNHYDHRDRAFLQWITQRDHPLIFVGVGTKSLFRGERLKHLVWWQTVPIPHGSITFVPVQHFSGRALWDRNKALWGGYVIKLDRFTVFFAGDTGFGPEFREIHKRFPNITLALLPVGGYAPRHFMGYVHLNPDDAIKVHQLLKPRFSLGMHWGTFQMTSEPRMEPKQRIEKLTRDKKIKNFFVPLNGDCFVYRAQQLRRCRVK